MAVSPRPKVVDVARHAGVSTATVSRVLNNSATVDPVMAARVHAAVSALGYRMNNVARSLRLQKNSVVGVVIPDISNPFFTEVVRGIGDALRDDGYLLMLCNSDENATVEATYLSLLAAQQVSGVIVAPADSAKSDLSDLRSAGIPTVVIDRLTETGEFDSVIFDNVGGSSSLTAKLIRQGRTHIAHIAGPERTFTANARRTGYRNALQAAGLPVHESLIVGADYSEAGGYRAARQILALPEKADAIMVANNAMTLGAIRALTESHVDPSSISLASFDPVPWSTSRRYPLLVLDHASMRMGSEAARLLLKRMEQPQRDREIVELSAGVITAFAD
ncbi:LacI family DNA-binding transcriptional regulator [Cryobacterium sp. PH29-G1]|uniref:LacI family DNA-binding transcriptional regulator n=1 Tax=Cryobacterium sp. PH29-G1 TaxID=3046211 RepID=UPI0024BBB789|nr:LacI family DNA-binding transcriptional regulator [Cryobacterium sp. PH29-G1]MDJ0350790.1 LacI family DNA-binding transcriptional regulator [Cryobacterium sp. PH29-G1]